MLRKMKKMLWRGIKQYRLGLSYTSMEAQEATRLRGPPQAPAAPGFRHTAPARGGWL